MSTRSTYYESMRPYWDARTSQEGLKAWEMAKVKADSRTCGFCGEEYDIEEFWTGWKVSGFCGECRAKTRRLRKKTEAEIASANEKKGRKGKGAISAVKDKVTDKVKGAVAAPAASMAGKAVGGTATKVLGDEVGALAEQTTKTVVKKALA